ncbi:protein ImuB [Paracoccus laeviglucosivorans]|uniref:Protein ImuB n=1 Tax=Paracoccus laeviglucosivorans TaxID=1197861 RepID=A0A521CV25_9RHOB|nr:protein ImuB [Paracoccus laeviglucosivorans]
MPGLAIENWQRKQTVAWPDDVPLALAAPGPHGPVIHGLNRAAALAGARSGARVTDMRAVCPTLRIEDADLPGDAACLARLAFWCRRWGPWSAPDRADGLLIDTTGADHLFGGEDAMLADMQGRLARAGLTAALAIAPTRGAAWALARFGAGRVICHDLQSDLAPLPVAGLRLDGPTLLLMRRLGLKTIGDLAAIPRLSLMRRFARADLPENPLLRLDQMLGHLAEPLDAPDPAPRFMAQTRLAEPVMDPTDWLPQLIADLCTQLAAKAQGCRRLRLSIFRVDGERRDTHLRIASPSREAAHLLRLFQGKLDGLDPGFGFDLLQLTAEAVEALPDAQPDLDARSEGLELARLIDRLTARFGAAAIHRPEAVESHIPERSETPAPPLGQTPVPDARPDRPLRLLTPPEEIRVLYAIPEGPPAQFSWRRQTLRVARYAGPERIAPEWWRDRPGTRLRDYFRVEDPSGLRLWIYREGLVHDGRGGTPRWFLHGIFA